MAILEHPGHGPTVTTDVYGNVVIDLHGWGHPLPPMETPLLDLIEKEPASGSVEEWRPFPPYEDAR